MRLLHATLILALSACASAPRGAPATHEHGAHGQMMDMCPMQVEGTTVAAEDTEGGAALTFTTTGDVAGLRQRVHHLAEMHGQPQEEHAMGCCQGQDMMKESTAVAEDVDGGARLSITPKDPAQLAALRQHVHEHAEHMAKGECPMHHGAM